MSAFFESVWRSGYNRTGRFLYPIRGGEFHELVSTFNGNETEYLSTIRREGNRVPFVCRKAAVACALLEKFEDAVEWMANIEARNLTAEDCYTTGMLYNALSMFDNANKYFKKSLKISTSIDAAHGLAVTSLGLVDRFGVGEHPLAKMPLARKKAIRASVEELGRLVLDSGNGQVEGRCALSYLALFDLLHPPKERNASLPVADEIEKILPNVRVDEKTAIDFARGCRKIKEPALALRILERLPGPPSSEDVQWEIVLALQGTEDIERMLEALEAYDGMVRDKGFWEKRSRGFALGFNTLLAIGDYARIASGVARLASIKEREAVLFCTAWLSTALASAGFPCLAVQLLADCWNTLGGNPPLGDSGVLDALSMFLEMDVLDEPIVQGFSGKDVGWMSRWLFVDWRDCVGGVGPSMLILLDRAERHMDIGPLALCRYNYEAVGDPEADPVRSGDSGRVLALLDFLFSPGRSADDVMIFDYLLDCVGLSGLCDEETEPCLYDADGEPVSDDIAVKLHTEAFQRFEKAFVDGIPKAIAGNILVPLYEKVWKAIFPDENRHPRELGAMAQVISCALSDLPASVALCTTAVCLLDKAKVKNDALVELADRCAKLADVHQASLSAETRANVHSNHGIILSRIRTVDSMEKAVAAMTKASDLHPSDKKFSDLMKQFSENLSGMRKIHQKQEEWLKTAPVRYPSLNPYCRKVLMAVHSVPSFESFDYLAEIAGVKRAFVKQNYEELVSAGMVVEDASSRKVNPYVVSLMEQSAGHVTAIRMVHTVGGEVTRYKPIFNSNGEYILYSALLELFPNYLVFPNLGLSAIFQFDRMKDLLEEKVITQKDFEYFLRAQIDFAIISTVTYLPQIGIELDSDYHDSDKQKQRDDRKDRLFSLGGVPLMRVRPMGKITKEEAKTDLARQFEKQWSRALSDAAEGTKNPVNVEIDFEKVVRSGSN